MAYYNRGQIYFSLGDNERAIQDFDDAIRLNPKLGVAYANRATAYTLLGMDEEAQRDVDRAIDLGVEADTLRRTIEDRRRQRQ